MLTITIPAKELYDEERNHFINTKVATLELEHSLVALSKWESKWKKSFLGRTEQTTEETIDYVRCMNLTPGVPDETFLALSNQNLLDVSEYINDKMTATWFSEVKNQSGSEVITAEIIYYWLVALQIDWRVETWHLNRLLTLVRVTNIKNDPKKKMMPKAEAAQQQRDLNAERKAKYNTRG